MASSGSSPLTSPDLTPRDKHADESTPLVEEDDEEESEIGFPFLASYFIQMYAVQLLLQTAIIIFVRKLRARIPCSHPSVSCVLRDAAPFFLLFPKPKTIALLRR